MNRVDEQQSGLLPTKLELDRLREQCKLLDQQNTQYKEEIEEKIDELLAARKTIARSKVQFESRLQESEAEREEKEKSNKNLQDLVDDLRSKLLKTEEEVNIKAKEILDAEHVHEKELETQAKLSNLYKQNSEDLTDRVKELEKGIEELQTVLSEKEDSFQDALKKQQEAMEEALQVAKQTAEEELTKLNAELTKAQETLTRTGGLPLEIANLSETAAGAELEKRGVTVTGIYSQLVDLQEISKKDKAEINRLNSYLEQILKDIETKAPAIAELREEYERVIAAYDEVSTKMVEAMAECSALKDSVKILTQERDKERSRAEACEQEAQDLGRQVQSLLKSQIESSSQMISSPEKEPKALSLTAESAISNNLVTVGSVDEMQKKNQQLLKVVRQLSKDLEEAEAQKEKERESEFELKFREAMQEIEDMRGSRERQEEMIAAIITQRDMYRSLLAQADASHADVTTMSKSINDRNDGMPSAHQKSGESTQLDLSRKLSQGSPKFARSTSSETEMNMKKLLEETRSEFAEFRERERISNQTLTSLIERQRETVSNATLEASRAKSETEYEKQRNKQLIESCDRYKSDCKRLQDVQVKLEQQIAEGQKLVLEKDEELKVSQGRERTIGADLQGLRVEKKLIEQELEHLRAHAKDMQMQRDSQRRVAESFEQVVDQLKSDQGSTIESLRTDKKKLEEEIHKIQTETRKAQHKSLQEEIRLTAEKKEMEGKLRVAKQEETRLKQEVLGLKTKLESGEEKEKLLKQQLDRHSKIAAQVRELRFQQQQKNPSSVALSQSSTSASPDNVELESLRVQLGSLSEELRKKSEDYEAYKAIASASEEGLKKLNSSTEKWKSESNSKIETLTKERDQLSLQLQEAEAKAKLDREPIERKAAELEARISQAESTAKECKAEADVAISNRKQALEDVQRMAADLKLASENYNRELQLHAKDSTALMESRAALVDLRKKYDALDKQFRDLQETQSREGAEREKEVGGLKESIARAEKEMSEYRRQNELLAEQVSRLSSQAKILQKRQADGAVDSTQEIHGTDKLNDDNQELARLRELFEISNRHKEIAILSTLR